MCIGVCFYSTNLKSANLIKICFFVYLFRIYFDYNCIKVTFRFHVGTRFYKWNALGFNINWFHGSSNINCAWEFDLCLWRHEELVKTGVRVHIYLHRWCQLQGETIRSVLEVQFSKNRWRGCRLCWRHWQARRAQWNNGQWSELIINIIV